MIRTADEEVAVRDGRPERVFGLAHVLSLVLGEHLDDHERALAPPHVHVDLEVLAGPHRLTVEVPGHLGRRHAAEEHAQHGAVAVRDCLVPQRHREPRRLLLIISNEVVSYLVIHQQGDTPANQPDN